MKKILFAALMALTTAPAFAADVGISLSIGQPGLYGRIDIGDFPQPQLIYPSPVIIQRQGGVVREPIYLHVPPGHAKKWSKHCHKYNACGQQVYFVQENWYNNEYVPQYSERHGKNKDGGKGKDKHKDKHKDKDKDRD